jgi:hypothetical protein
LNLEPLLPWAVEQAAPGSVIAAFGEFIPDVSPLLNGNWRVLYISPSPCAICELRGRHMEHLGSNMVTLTAAVDPQARKYVQNGNDLAAGIHPNELFALFAEPNPPLPGPRILLLDASAADDGPAVLSLFAQWVRLDAFAISVRTSEQAHEVGNWLSGGWRVVKTEELTLWATRFVP